MLEQELENTPALFTRDVEPSELPDGAGDDRSTSTSTEMSPPHRDRAAFGGEPLVHP
jgi:hypothetical protein